MATAWHTLDPEEVADRLGVEPERGLDAGEAADRLAEHGPNAIRAEEPIHPWRILWGQLTEPLVLVLLAAAGVSALVWWAERGGDGEALPWDALVILAIVVLNAAIGFAQEYRAERAVHALQEMAAPQARLLREGEVVTVDATEVVPGDVLVLESGDRITADARLLRASSLKAQEAALTGESVAVEKRPAALDDPDLAVGDRASMVFMGSAITYGTGRAVVVATGQETEMGRIASLIEGVQEEATPLQAELARVGRQLGWLVVGIGLVVAAAGALRAGTLDADVLLDIFLFGVALAVAAIPEGLPAIVTAALALGVRRMADRNAIVRHLPAVETLGSATVICSDKTGTLTRGEMTVRRLLLATGDVVEVSGEGFEPEGEFRRGGETVDPAQGDLERLLRLAALANDAALRREDGRWTVRGDTTEAALLVAARKAGREREELEGRWPRRAEVPFSSERKRMTTLHGLPEAEEGGGEGELLAIVKGAPEVLLERCDRLRVDGGEEPLDDAAREELREQSATFADAALRTLAVASRRVAAGAVDPDDPDADAIETGLIWEGMFGLIDPPRSRTADSVAEAAAAGIRTIVITGDHPGTALAVAREIGIVEEGAEVLTGRDLAGIADDELDRAVRRVSVFARVDPEDKLRIVRTLEAQGEIVAMTGDGVNDAPALKEADIGIAMGIQGTDVSREASDMVLADDDYSTIVAAISEGRRIFDNIRKFIRYLLSSNAGEVLTMFAGIMAAGILGLGTPGEALFLPLLAVQILWINLVTDGAPALALGLDPPAPGLMRRPPRDPAVPIIHHRMWAFIAVVGLVMMAGTLGVLDAYLPGGLLETARTAADDGGDRARTMAFTTLVLFQLFNVFNCRDPRRTVFRRGSLVNRWLLGAVVVSLGLQVVVVHWAPFQRAFRTVDLTAADWGIAAAVAASVVAAAELFAPVARAVEGE